MPTELPSPRTFGIRLTGCGSAVPAIALSNDQLAGLVDTSDEWIASRTGIRQRYVAGPDESLSDLAAQAAERAIAMAGLRPQDLDLVVLATSTPDDLFGSAGLIQGKLGATQAVAFDLTAACSGFVFGLTTVAQFLRTGVYRNAVLIGGDVLSRWVDWHDRRTCVLFGDGAGAVVLQATTSLNTTSTSDDPQASLDGLLGFELRSDGSQNGVLNLGYGPKPQVLLDDVTIGTGHFQPISMNGQEIYRFAVKKVPEVIEKALFRAELTVAELDWLLLHQANQRIMDAVADRLGLPRDRVLSNLAQHGNTSAASIPLCLDEAVRSGQVQPGQTIALAGFGAGLSWGSAIVRWGGPV